jgi:hypothetical protein
MRMTARTRAVVAAATLAAAFFTPVRATAAGDGFVIVVNQANTLTHSSRAEISKVFLGRTPAWPGGVAATPCDLSGTSPLRKTFSESVHGKPVWVIVAFWQQEIASGRSRPPSVCASEEAALKAVRESAGGVAYVSEGTPLGSGVKVLAVTP